LNSRLLNVVETEAAIVGVSCVELIFTVTEDPVCVQAGVGGLKANYSLPSIKKIETFSSFSSSCSARLLNVVEAETAIVGISWCVTGIKLIFSVIEYLAF
jgi:hypothetical protein